MRGRGYWILVVMYVLIMDFRTISFLADTIQEFQVVHRDGMLAMEKGLVFVIGTSKLEILNSTYTVLFIRDPSLG